MTAVHAAPIARPLTRTTWVIRYRRQVIAGDLLMICLAVIAGYFGRFGWQPPVIAGVPYALVGAGCVAAWVLALQQMRCYDGKVLGHGTDEYRRVAAASLHLAAFVAIGCYLTDTALARGFVGIAGPLGIIGLLATRFLARKWLHRRRRTTMGWSHRVLVVGGEDHVVHLVRQLRREPFAGYNVVGVCLPDGYDHALPSFPDIPIVGSPRRIREAIAHAGADTVMVTSSTGITAGTLRELGWELEGLGVDLVVAPSLTDVAGPRIHTRPVAGLPLLHVEEPELAGPRRTAKNLLERVLALAALILLLPVFAIVALWVRADSPGPAIFRQARVGKLGRVFTLYKFRSMVVDAELALPEMATLNEKDSVLFKIRRDPRVTRAGRHLRKWSLDELPQLINVIRGDMALVGPRPPLPAEVAQYPRNAARRLLVRPGLTGLWQVSGRSELSWEDSVRLDLYYVENWSLTADLVILWKTLGAVLRGDGAY
ncbi:sugar transferase [Nonomuraea endophytica]|uniref:sugar transferase n=1 Tax=Nonomuraea endophytica TaxID=714136 RepID=UPI0037C99129